MKGFCSYHSIHVPHAQAEELLAAMPAEFRAYRLQVECAEVLKHEIWRHNRWKVGYEADMRIADAIIAFGKRRGLVRFDRSKRLWVRASQTPADAPQPTQAVTAPGKYPERLTTAEDRG